MKRSRSDAPQRTNLPCWEVIARLTPLALRKLKLTAQLKRLTLSGMRLAVFCFVASAILSPLSQAQAPVFVITQQESTIKFYVKASVSLHGSFDKWDATLTFTSPDVATGVLDVKIQAASVNTGSGMKDDKLKSKDFFDVKQDPLITFRVEEDCTDRSQHL